MSSLYCNLDNPFLFSLMGIEPNAVERCAADHWQTPDLRPGAVRITRAQKGEKPRRRKSLARPLSGLGLQGPAGKRRKSTGRTRHSRWLLGCPLNGSDRVIPKRFPCVTRTTRGLLLTGLGARRRSWGLQLLWVHEDGWGWFYPRK